MITIRSSYVRHRVSHAVQRSQSVARKEVSRLSSGKRLTSAADDTAGKAMETQLFARNRSRRVAQRNTNYARDLCRVAQGGLNAIRTSIIKLKALAVQAASDGINDRERGYLQKEADDLIDHIDKVAFTTKAKDAQPLLYQVPVDIGFIVDTSSSMDPFMTALKQEIDAFADNVVAKGFNVEFGLSKASTNAVNGDNVDASVLAEDVGSQAFDSTLAALTTDGGGFMDMYSSMVNAGSTDHPGTKDPDTFGWRTGAQRYFVVLTDTVAQEGPRLLPGDPSQQVVADEINGAQITAHIIAPNGAIGGFNLIASTTGGSFNNIGAGSPNVAIAAALAKIETAIAADLEATSQYVFQTGVDNTAASRVESNVAIDATSVGLQLQDFKIDTLAAAQGAMDDVDLSLDLLNERATTYAVLENKLERLLDNTASTIVDESAWLAHIGDTDIAESTTEFAAAKVKTENSINLLRLYGQLKSSLVMNLVDNINRSVQGGLYAGLA